MTNSFSTQGDAQRASPGLVDIGETAASRHGRTPPEQVATLTSSAVERAYGRLAPLYDLVFGRVLEPGRRMMAAAAAELDPPTLLEIGVGTGLTLAGYPASTAVTGIDISPDMLEKARRRAAALRPRPIELALMDAESMDFADASFDCVTLPYVLSVTPDPDRLVREIRRVCKPGGTILIVNHFSGSRFWRGLEHSVSSLASRIGFRSDFDYARHVLSHGWQVEWRRPVNLFDLSLLIRIRN
ncbi:MAG: class I SAM-dependent methyltransferase [Lautropia sp.]